MNQIIDSDQLKTMSPEEIRDADKQGRFRLLYRGINIRKQMSDAQWAVAIKYMDTAQFEAARRDGLIPAHLLGEAQVEPTTGADQGARTPHRTQREDLKHMSPEQIRDALKRGELDDLLAGRGPAPRFP